MNNKGQVLVIFIILLPIFLIIFTLVADLGLMYVEKRNITNNIKDALEFYLNNSDDIKVKEKTEKLLETNIDNIKIDIKDNREYVEITIEKEYNGINNILKNEDTIEITYKGIKEDKSIIKG